MSQIKIESPTEQLIDWLPYDTTDKNIAYVRGANVVVDPATGKSKNDPKLSQGTITNSLINRLHLVKLEGCPPNDKDYKSVMERAFSVKTFLDLVMLNKETDIAGFEYNSDDFNYCTKKGYPINHMITLRRFPFPCIDNIYDTDVQPEPDIARMVTYFDQETNKLEDILSFSYGLRWKQLTAEYEQATMQGEQTGLSGFMLKGAQLMGDEELVKNRLRGEVGSNVDPKYDQNRVYGPVDSINETHIREVGLDFSKEFDITFEYSLRDYGGRTPEYVMKDIISNVLACTYTDADFWPGARFWVGKRPSKALNKYKWMNSDNIDDIFTGFDKTLNDFKASLKSFFESKGTAIDTLKKIISGSIGAAIGKILDKVGRPGIVTTSSLLSGEPVGLWHLTIGNPVNPILCMGNLLCTGVDVKFPEDSLSYGDFVTKMVFNVKLKPAMPRDRAGIEMMFNMGKGRIYWPPAKVEISKNASPNSPYKKNSGTIKTKDSKNNEVSALDMSIGNLYHFVVDKSSTGVGTVIVDGVAKTEELAKKYMNTNKNKPTESNL